MSMPISAYRANAEIGSHTTRFAVMGDNDQLQLIYAGPGTQSPSRPVYSKWTRKGFLLTPNDTDDDLFVHPFNTIFNLKHPLDFSLKDSSSTKPNIIGYQTWTLQEMTAKYLEKLQTSGESIIGQKIEMMVVVKPLNSHLDKEMELRYDAIRQANFDASSNGVRMDMVRKSALLPALFNKDVKGKRTVLIYHLGGSSLRITVLLQKNGYDEILSFADDTDFGGKDFNQRLVDYLILAHEKRTSRNLSKDDKFMMRLRRAVEKAKRVLSSRNAVRIEIESSSLSSAFGNRRIFSELVTRSQFEELNKDLFARTILAVNQAIQKANMTREDIQDIIMSETAALFGAAQVGQWGVDFEEGRICCFESGPLSVGIETAGGTLFRFADENSDRSIRKSADFSTTTDNQDRVMIRIFEGQRALAKENTFLGQLEFSGITLAPKGMTRIRVSIFAGSCENALHLTVTDLTTGRRETKMISPRTAYHDDHEIERKKEEAIPFKHLDRMVWESAKMAGTHTLLNPI
ncbi:hypothetical protein EMPS_04265 [Entomortierella parvispora]|uniref:Uncharacterized protein n=1 Tax=Entomortierella parvispora TaxID=205924 RepID=A0A9P3H8R9_9FUNG|nr:hypothetical protein EMPS_04265 [Entomortierella parvispora]